MGSLPYRRRIELEPRKQYSFYLERQDYHRLSYKESDMCPELAESLSERNEKRRKGRADTEEMWVKYRRCVSDKVFAECECHLLSQLWQVENITDRVCGAREVDECVRPLLVDVGASAVREQLFTGRRSPLAVDAVSADSAGCSLPQPCEMNTFSLTHTDVQPADSLAFFFQFEYSWLGVKRNSEQLRYSLTDLVHHIMFSFAFFGTLFTIGYIKCGVAHKLCCKRRSRGVSDTPHPNNDPYANTAAHNPKTLPPITAGDKLQGTQTEQ